MATGPPGKLSSEWRPLTEVRRGRIVCELGWTPARLRVWAGLLDRAEPSTLLRYCWGYRGADRMIAPTLDELRARVTEKGPWFTVPAETRPTQCTGCGAVIFFITTAAGKSMPVDVLVPGGQMPRRDGVAEGEGGTLASVRGRDGRGVAHWGTCPKANAFRKQRSC